jgi:signal peptidase I
MKKLAAAGLVLAAVAVVLLVAARVFFVRLSVVPQNGMYPTIPAGSRLLSWKRPYARVEDVRRGDIVLFNRVANGARYLYVWRVVGVPGDTVRAVKDSVSLNGSPLKREPLRDEGSAAILRETVGGRSYEIAIDKAPRDVPPDVDVRLAPDELFVMGDNRYHAVDSRYFGPIKFAAVVGKRL